MTTRKWSPGSLCSLIVDVFNFDRRQDKSVRLSFTSALISTESQLLPFECVHFSNVIHCITVSGKRRQYKRHQSVHRPDAQLRQTDQVIAPGHECSVYALNFSSTFRLILLLITHVRETHSSERPIRISASLLTAYVVNIPSSLTFHNPFYLKPNSLWTSRLLLTIRTPLFLSADNWPIRRGQTRG